MSKTTFALTLIFLFMSVNSVVAFYDPANAPNNRIGVHILDPKEIIEAAKLVNSQGGDWGYVTIPIRSDDRDRVKWDFFLKSCTTLHVIPILRLATYFDGSNWVAPTGYDLVDFANFLSDLPWPIGNRYLVIFNEPNHSKEWGGVIDPAGYATILIQSKAIFKSHSSDFYILSAGLDLSAPTNHTSLDALQFYRLMTKTQPSWYQAIDGLSVHAYPNPNFTAPITSTSRYGPKSYLYEQQLLKTLGFLPKPIFITETGNTLGDDIYTTGFSKVWTESNIIAITPFLFFAGTGDFSPFSLLDLDHKPKKSYLALYAYPKITGSPQLNPARIIPSLPLKTTLIQVPPSAPNFLDLIKRYLTPSLPQLTITSSSSVISIFVEIATTPKAVSHGLSDRSSLPSDHGMLFVFPSPKPLTFWMKDMLFPLDFIWIRNNTIIGFHQNILPPAQTNSQPMVITSPGLANQVLEVNAGFISAHHLSIGDKVSL